MLYGAIAASKIRPPTEGAALFFGTGNLTVPVNLLLNPTARFAGIGSLIASGSIAQNPIQQGAAVFAGIGSFSLDSELTNPIQQGSALFAGSGSFSLDAALSNPSWQGQAEFAGMGSLSVSEIQIANAFSKTLNGNSGLNGEFTQREAITFSRGGTHVRVTFVAATDNALTVNHAAIGKQNSGYNTTSVPTELKFGGSSGFSLSAGQSITSDWETYSTTSSEVHLVVVDTTGGGQRVNADGTATRWTTTDIVNSYNVASPTGTWTPLTSWALVSNIDVYS